MGAPALFVATSNTLETSGGGVQVCTGDYLTLIRGAGYDLTIVDFEPDQRLLTKIARRVERRPYLRMMPPTLLPRIEQALADTGAESVFFCLYDYPGIALALRQRHGDRLNLVHLSYGLDSTDLCIDQQSRRTAGATIAFDRRTAQALGAKIHCEADYRRYLDASLCLSPLDAELERWLGTRHTAWFPRPVREPALDLKPIAHRVGSVATLNHPPNYLGLVDAFTALGASVDRSFRFRLVGGPTELGEDLARRFPFVDYVGRIPDDQLREEAAGWSCFVHPIFHYARGCSTKLAVALGWGLPVATTVDGARGYLWDEAVTPLARTPAQLAAQIAAASGRSGFEARAAATRRLAALQPSMADLSRQVASFLKSIEIRGAAAC